MKRFIWIAMIVLALSLPAAASGSAGFQIREVRSNATVVLWGDRSGHPLASCSSTLALHEMGLIRDASAQTSTVSCEAYTGGVLKAFNLDR